jgi:hypothetical protein
VSAVARTGWAARPIRARSVAAGVAAGLGLVVAYLSIISVAQGVGHAFEQFSTDALFVGLVALGFGTQVALFVELRAVDRRHRGAAAATAAATGTSTAAMLACCAHHLADLLPLVGLSGAAVFLGAYKTPLLLLGLGMNLVGIVVIGRQLRAARRACALTESGPVAGPVRRGGEVRRQGGAPMFAARPSTEASAVASGDSDSAAAHGGLRGHSPGFSTVSSIAGRIPS